MILDLGRKVSLLNNRNEYKANTKGRNNSPDEGVLLCCPRPVHMCTEVDLACAHIAPPTTLKLTTG